MRFGLLGHWKFGFACSGRKAGGKSFLLPKLIRPEFWLACLLSFIVLAVIADSSWAAANGKRLALVIGNSNYKYKNALDLPNAAGDADAIAQKLDALGFEVDTGIDVDLDSFESLVLEFRDKIKSTGAEDVVFYYAGHGFQLDDRNHLVPIDARLSSRERIGNETVQLNRLIKQINTDPRKQRTIVFLDACRDNPLPESVRGEDYENGLADVQMGKDGDNVLVVFSTRPGEVSQDGKGSNSPFAEALIRHIGTPNETVNDMIAAVSNEVYEATLTRQTPRVSGILRSKFYFNLKSSIVVAPDPTDGQDAEQQTADGGEGPPKPPKTPSVILSESDGDSASPPADITSQPDQMASVEVEQSVAAPAIENKSASPPSETVSQLDQIADSEAKQSVVEPATVTVPSSLAVTDARQAAGTASPETPVESVTLEAQDQAVVADAQDSTPWGGPIKPPTVEAVPTRPAGTVVARLDPKETAQESAASSSVEADPAPDRGIAVIRPSQAKPSSGVPVSEKPVMIAQRSAGDPALRPFGERFLDDENLTAATDSNGGSAEANGPVTAKEPGQPNQQVASLTSPTETVEPPGTEPESVEQPDITQQVQEGLSRVGCFDGQADGQWGPDSDAALAKYIEQKGAGDPAAGPTEDIFALLEAESEQVCSTESAEPEPPTRVKKPADVKKAPISRKPPVVRKPPTTKKPAIVRKPPAAKKPTLVRKPPVVKKPPVKVVTKQPKQPKQPKTPSQPSKTPPKIPKMQGFSF